MTKQPLMNPPHAFGSFLVKTVLVQLDICLFEHDI